jgi:iron complex outermembrane recepter protein
VHGRGLFRLAGLLVCLGTAPAAAAEPTPSPAPPRRDLTELSLAELAALEVTTVARTPETRVHTPAAVFVITQQDIRRSGATTLAEALRLAPGVQVSRISSNQWAIGMRGFASRLARSVLVLIDGRSVYTPLFAGTYWEVQDVLLEDVERIEVIRGPGGTLWGANAVNGVINVITRSAHDTRGTYLDAGGGKEERGFGAARWGGSLGAHADVRVYAKYFDRGAAFHPDGDDFDRWHMAQGGFRVDGASGPSTFTLQGDLYGGRAGERTVVAAYAPPFARTIEADAQLGGGNVRGRWQRTLAGGAELDLQAYYDHTHRVEPNFREDRDTGDADAQYRLTLGAHQFLSCLGIRLSRGATEGIPTLAFHPATRTDDVFSGFVQDRIEVVRDRLLVTVGTKVEHSNYSGFEVMPSGRVLWMPGPRHSVWAAVTRAVRTPSRVERDLDATFSLDPARPVFGRLAGGPAFLPERLVAYEAGYRMQYRERAIFDVALFYNDYSRLLSVEPGAPFVETGAEGPRTIVPFELRNGIRGKTQGLEVAGDLRLSGALRLHASYSFLNLDLSPAAGSRDTTTEASTEGSSPRHRILLRSSLTLGTVQLDAAFRRVSALPAQDVAAYSSLDARAAWRPWSVLELAVVGRDLLSPHHREFGGGTEVERAVYAEAAWRF